MKTFISILLSSILLMQDCSHTEDYYDFFIHNKSDESIYICEGGDHKYFCAHSEMLHEITQNSIYNGKAAIINGEAYTYYVYVFKKSTLEKYSVEEIERNKIRDGLYIVNAIDCREGINNEFVFKGE